MREWVTAPAAREREWEQARLLCHGVAQDDLGNRDHLTESSRHPYVPQDSSIDAAKLRRRQAALTQAAALRRGRAEKTGYQIVPQRLGRTA